MFEFIKLLVHLIFLVFYGIYAFGNLIFRKIVPRFSKSLEGKIFLITGAASGIGREVAIHLAKNHVRTKLVLWDFNAEQNEETAETARFFGAKVFTYTVDVSSHEEVEETAKKVVEEVGDVTILFNNAGVAGLTSILGQTPAKIEKTIQVNLLSHFWTLKAFLPNMILKNRGHIVTTVSLAGWGGLRNDAPYSASKFGVRGYLESLQSELLCHPLKPRNIKFTTIYPWFIRTPMATGVQIKTRFSYFLELMEPRYVAENIVQSICKDEEIVFLPRILEPICRFKSLMPQLLLDRVEDFFGLQPHFL